MKKYLLSLLLFFGSIISFGHGVNLVGLDGYSYNISPGSYNQENNHFYGKDSVLCISLSDLSDLGVKFIYYRETKVGNNSNFYYSYGQRDIGTSRGFVCGMLPGNSQTFYSIIGFDKRGITYTIYQFAGLGGDGSDLAINFVDSYTNNTNKLNFHLDDGDDIAYSIYYNSNNTPISVNNSSSIVNLASRYDNLQCESHIQFQDISNGTGVKTLSSYFSPFSGANNNSVYYDSDENVVQIDSQYGVAEIISAVPIVPPEPDDCSEAISGAVASCNNQLSILSGNYNSCLGELNSCMNGSVSTGDIQWSALYINNIQHLGKPIINISIPEEISWDYVSTGDIFDLSVVGYNVDPDYIEGIINLQNTKPTEEDFNKLVSEVVPLLVPGLFIIAFLYFAFRFIKKVF